MGVATTPPEWPPIPLGWPIFAAASDQHIYVGACPYQHRPHRNQSQDGRI
jgi:hypothetical protein